MKKRLLIFLFFPLIGFGQHEILAKYNGTELLNGAFYEMNLLLCDCYSYSPNKDLWKDKSSWENEDYSLVLKLSYYADVNINEDGIEYYTISEEVEQLKVGDVYWIELEFHDLNDIFFVDKHFLLSHSAEFIRARKATDNEISEYFFLEEEDSSDW